MKINHKPRYRDKRVEAHLSVGDQLDMIYRTLKAAGIKGEFIDYVDGVKARYPKG